MQGGLSAFMSGALRRFRSFTFTLTLISVGILLVVLLVGQAGFARGIVEELRQEAAEIVASEMREISQALDHRSVDYAQNLITAALDADRDGRLIMYLARDDGTFLEGNLTMLPTMHAQKNGLLEFHLPEDLPESMRAHGEDLSGKYYAQQVRHPKGYQLMVAYRMTHLQSIEDRIGSRVNQQTLLSLILAIAGSLLFTSVILHRLRSLNDTCRRLADGDLSARAHTTGSNDEFDQLSQNFNAMLGRIEHLVSSIRQTGDNLAHDMRTPLTRLRNTLATIESQPVVEHAIEQIDQLSSMLDAILLLARAEAGTLAMERETVDVQALLSDMGEMLQPLAEARGHVLEVMLPDHAHHVQGQRQLLMLALSNLVDNAIKYAPAGGVIRLSATANDATITLAVEDQGPGIPVHLREHAKDRFVQLDSSRHAGGAGIGLSFVKAVARLHGAQFVLADATPGAVSPGLRAELVIPREQRLQDT